jgi:hypothetical protein
MSAGKDQLLLEWGPGDVNGISGRVEEGLAFEVFRQEA